LRRRLLTAGQLLAVTGEHPLATLGEFGAILLQTRQNHEITLIHHLSAKAGDITGAGFLLLLCSAAPLMLGLGGHDKCKRQGREKSQKLQPTIPSSKFAGFVLPAGRSQGQPAKTHEKYG
jgi:hypothetical protein